jgi:hypothetical protein
MVGDAGAKEAVGAANGALTAGAEGRPRVNEAKAAYKDAEGAGERGGGGGA